nr:DNA mismatch repair protein MSH1 [Crypthecodinium cohnii]
MEALKRCRIPSEFWNELGAAPTSAPAAAPAGRIQLQDVQEWTKDFIKEVWKDATSLGHTKNKDGSPMRLGAGIVAKSFLQDAKLHLARSGLGGGPDQDEADGLVSGALHQEVGTWLKPEALGRQEVQNFEEGDFQDFVPTYWKEELARVDRAEALNIIQQLGGDDLIGWLRSKANGSVGGLFKQVLGWRAEFPEAVLLVQVGDFFESWGSDAVMLVQWSGLRPMARRPRAGFPATAAALQQVLDSLTTQGLSAAVFVQTGPPGTTNQPRCLRQVVTPGMPTYLHGHELGRSNESNFSEGRPYVALRLGTDGVLFAEMRPFRREISFRAGVTPEAVEALLLDGQGVAEPIFVASCNGAAQEVRKWTWMPKHRKFLNLPDEVSDSQFLDTCCKTLCSMLHQEAHPPFQRIRLESNGALQPLTMVTAANLGVLPRKGVPSLVDVMLDHDASAASRRLIRRWLLAPRGPDSVKALRHLIKTMSEDRTLTLPPLTKGPSVAQAVAYLTARTAKQRLLRDIRLCVQQIHELLSTPRYGQLLPPLLTLTAAEIGGHALERGALLGEVDNILELFDTWLLSSSSRRSPNESSDESSSEGSSIIGYQPLDLDEEGVDDEEASQWVSGASRRSQEVDSEGHSPALGSDLEDDDQPIQVEAPRAFNLGDETNLRTFQRFTECNETFRGILSLNQPSVREAYDKVGETKLALQRALHEAIANVPGNVVEMLIYNAVDNDVTLKSKPKNLRSLKARDRKMKEKANRYITSDISTAMRDYLEATQAAEAVITDGLYQLSAALAASLQTLRAVIVMHEILGSVHHHCVAGRARGWQLPQLSEDGRLDVQLMPYWLHGDAVPSRVCLAPNSGSIATGPNMSGKSTLMRALGSAALLGNCGFMAPAAGVIPAYAQVVFLAAEGDRPGEGISAFGQEALLSSTLLQRACNRTLALLDEFGRGTEPLAAKACIGALVEELSRRGSHFVVATHLHDVVDLPLDLPLTSTSLSTWRMGIRKTEDGDPHWTYTLEDGVCHDSYAWVALRRFGWPEAALQRFFRLLQHGSHRTDEIATSSPRAIPPMPPSPPPLGTQDQIGDTCTSDSNSNGSSQSHDDRDPKGQEHGSASFGRTREVDLTTTEATSTFAGDPTQHVRAALAEVAGVSTQEVVDLRPSRPGGAWSTPPAALSDGVAVVYVLLLSGAHLYVGQSDTLRGRLAQHRRTHGQSLEGMLVTEVMTNGGGTAAARLAETTLSRRLTREGFSLSSSHDAMHQSFGLATSSSPSSSVAPSALASTTTPTVTMASDSQQLRKMAADLLALADRLEGRDWPS